MAKESSPDTEEAEGVRITEKWIDREDFDKILHQEVYMIQLFKNERCVEDVDNQKDKY